MPYTEHGEKERDHSPPGQHLPGDVNSAYNAIMRDKFHGEDSEENQSQAMAIAWAQHNKKHKDSAANETINGITPKEDQSFKCPHCEAVLQSNIGYELCPYCGMTINSKESSVRHLSVTEGEFESLLREWIESGLMESEQGGYNSTSTYAEAGVLTYNKGLEVRLNDGSAFQITIVQSEYGENDEDEDEGEESYYSKKSAWRTRQWQCPECGEWDYEGLGSGGHGRPWHDCKNCGYSEKSPTNIEQRFAPLDWDEDEQGAYDYDDWYDREGNPHVDKRLSKYQIIAIEDDFNPWWGDRVVNDAEREKADRRQDKVEAEQFQRGIDEQIPDSSPGDVIAAYRDGTIVLDDGITTYNPERARRFIEQGGTYQDDNPHHANYKVIALGEMQQPSGVGATQTTGLTDGLPKPNQEEGEELSTDAGKNSFEQNVALETWVNFAVDMLNRSTDEQQILAQLAHDGCPDPQGVLERAKKQPFDNTPVEGAEDPFEVPFKEDGYDEQQESVERQPPVTQSVASWQPDPRRIYRTSDKITLDDLGGPIGEADKPKDADMSILQDVDGPSDEDQAELFDTDDPDKTDNSTPPIKFKEKVEVQEVKDYPKSSKVHIKNTSWRGIVLDQYEDLWGQKLAKVALSDGGTVTVAPSQLEVDDPLAANDPVSDIQTFIDNLPVVEPTRPSIMSHITNLEMVRRACRANISKVGFSDQLKLEEFDRKAQVEISHLKEAFSNTTNDFDSEYLASLPRYQSGDGSRQQDDAFNSRLNERAAIFVSELPLEVRQDAGQLAFAAARFADKNNGNIPAFVTAAQHWAKDWEKPWEKKDEDEDNEDNGDNHDENTETKE